MLTRLFKLELTNNTFANNITLRCTKMLFIFKIFLITLAGFNCNHIRDDRHYILKVKKMDGVPFAILRRPMNWGEGDAECERMVGTKLVVLPTKAESDFLATAIKNMSVSNDSATPDFWSAIEKYEFPMDRRYWIGLSDLGGAEGDWYWRVTSNVSMKLAYDNWYIPSDHVNIEGKREHCVVLWNPHFYKDNNLHTFNDEPCMNMHYPICELPPDV